MNVIHLFHDVFMGCGHASLMAMLQENTKIEELGNKEIAVFLNKSWTACKILAPGNMLLYYRSPTKAPLTIQTIRYLPTLIGGSRLTFKKNVEDHLMANYEKKFGKKMERLKVMYA